jgi:hypothetical protein
LLTKIGPKLTTRQPETPPEKALIIVRRAFDRFLQKFETGVDERTGYACPVRAVAP